MSKPRLMIARFPGNNQEHPASSGWVMDLCGRLAREGEVDVVPFRRSDTPITMVRNLAVKQALDQECDYILMIDADMHPDLEVGRSLWARPFWDVAWPFLRNRRLREQAVGVPLPPATIAAPYCGPPPHENVYVMEWRTFESDTPNPSFALGQVDREDAARRSGIQEVAALPTGLILYDARVFAALPPPWFDYEWADPPFNTAKATTEDIFQTRNASLLKMPQYIAWDCWAGHIKLKTVGRPKPLTADVVSDQIAASVRAGHVSTERTFYGQPEMVPSHIESEIIT
jgi:hypothetical protein